MEYPDVERDLEDARSIYESEVRAAMARRDRKIRRARDAGLSARRISRLSGYSVEHVTTMVENATTRETEDPEPARQLDLV